MARALSYPTVIFDVDISAFANEIFHYIKTVSFLSGHMQGSHLMEKKTLHTSTNQSTDCFLRIYCSNCEVAPQTVGRTSLPTWLQLDHILCWVLYLKLTMFQTSRDLKNPWQICIKDILIYNYSFLG